MNCLLKLKLIPCKCPWDMVSVQCIKLFCVSNYISSRNLSVSSFILKPKKTSTATVSAGLTDEQLKAGWAPADIEYPFVFKCTCTPHAYHMSVHEMKCGVTRELVLTANSINFP